MLTQKAGAVISAFVFSLLAAVQPGENLISNGELQSDRSDTPPTCWATEQNIQYLGYHSNGGPENRPYVSF